MENERLSRPASPFDRIIVLLFIPAWAGPPEQSSGKHSIIHSLYHSFILSLKTN